MKKSLSAALAAMFITLFFAGMAEAVPTDVTVRIEGLNATLFDRVVRSDGHDIQAAGDTVARKCDGTNLGANESPGATATAATVDAMSIIGTDFGGSWYDGYEDYFIERFGPEAESNENGWWWGILVNREFTPVGGCQFRVEQGDEVLWVLEAFNGRPFLSLDGPETAVVGQPIQVEVTDFTDAAYDGATVSGLTAAAAPVAPGITVPGTSDAEGKAMVTFTEPGWKRLKAYDPADDAEPIADAVPSNSIDICVERVAGSGCTGIAPAKNPAQVGQAPAVEVTEPGDPDPDPDPTCETDPSLCPKPDPDPKPDPKPEGASKLRLGKVELGQRRVRPGGSAKVAFTVRNAGETASGQVRACLRSKPGRVRQPCRSLGSIASGAEKRLTFTVRARRGQRAGTKLRLSLSVSEDGARRIAKTARLGVTRKR